MITFKTYRIEEARAIKGWSRTKLSSLVGIHPSSYLRIIKGEIRKAETIKKLADALGLRMEDLVVTEQETSKVA